MLAWQGKIDGGRKGAVSDNVCSSYRSEAGEAGGDGLHSVLLITFRSSIFRPLRQSSSLQLSYPKRYSILRQSSCCCAARHPPIRCRKRDSDHWKSGHRTLVSIQTLTALRIIDN